MKTDPFTALKKASRDPALCASLLKEIAELSSGRQIRFMEVCGTHTTALFQSGLRPLLPESFTHLSGPGCPVCVTHEAEVTLFLSLSEREDIIIATFGDLLRVPGPNGNSLKHASAQGARIEIVYSPLDALRLAAANPGKETVFLAAGFETTAPLTAALLLKAREAGIANLSVFSMHKLVPPALRSLVAQKDAGIDAFLLPGHVATITGLDPFRFLASEALLPAVVAGFEPVDLLLALRDVSAMLNAGEHAVKNAYPRAVHPEGNLKAQALLNEVFEIDDAHWRGLGPIEKSGLKPRPEFAEYDVMKKFGLALPQTSPLPGCRCGEILKGRLQPGQCPLFGKTCTPANPKGPCMVSTEGSCAAHYKYGWH